MKHKKIKQIIDFLSVNTFTENSLASRNISELIKYIPYIGSLINANTIEAFKDKKLEERLNELENSLEEKVSYVDGEIILDLIENNRNLLYVIIAQFQDIIFENNKELIKQLTPYLAIPKNSKETFKPNNDFKLVVISGTSAVGKDTIVDKIVKKDFPKTAHVDLFRKFTTRKKRIMDSHYYKFLSVANYNKFILADKIVFPYDKREHNYGFNKEQLFKVSQTNTILFCVFTEFKMVSQTKTLLKEQGISSIFILLEAPEKDLIDRSWRRNFKEDEVRRRINSIRQDTFYIENNEKEIDSLFDYRLDNGDNVAVEDTYNKIVDIVRNNATQQKL